MSLFFADTEPWELPHMQEPEARELFNTEYATGSAIVSPSKPEADPVLPDLVTRMRLHAAESATGINWALVMVLAICLGAPFCLWAIHTWGTK